MVLLQLLAFVAGAVAVAALADAVTNPFEFFTRPFRTTYARYAA